MAKPNGHGRNDKSPNGPPQGTFAVPDTALVSEDALVPVPIDVLANDGGPDNLNARRVVAVDTTGTEGAVVIASDGGSVTYAPDGQFERLGAGEQATDSFTYTLQLGRGAKDTATVTVTVTGVNDAPEVEDASFTIPENQAAQAIGIVTATDVDANDILSFAITTGNNAGLFAINPSTGEVSTTGALDFETAPEHLLTVGVSDGNGGVAEAKVLVHVLDQDEVGAPIVSIVSVDGTIFDVSQDSVLYVSESTGSSILHIMELETGFDQGLPSTGALAPEYGFLSTDGAIFAAMGDSVLETGVFHYRDGQLQNLGELNSWLSLRSEGDYAIWSGTAVNDPETSLLNWGLYRIDLQSSEVMRAPYAPRETGNWQNDITSDGLVTLWTSIGFSAPGDQTTDYNIFTFDGDELTRITNFSPDFSIYPRSDGEIIAFTREEVCCSTDFSQLVLYDGESFEVLRETSAELRATPDRDYQVEEGQVAFRSMSGELMIRHEDGAIEETGDIIAGIIDLGPNGDVVASVQDGALLRYADGTTLDLPADVKGAHYADEEWLVFTDDEIFLIRDAPDDISVPSGEPGLLFATAMPAAGDMLTNLIDDGNSAQATA
jgi:VCBS repeat-containing protein